MTLIEAAERFQNCPTSGRLVGLAEPRDQPIGDLPFGHRLQDPGRTLNKTRRFGRIERAQAKLRRAKADEALDGSVGHDWLGIHRERKQSGSSRGLSDSPQTDACLQTNAGILIGRCRREDLDRHSRDRTVIGKSLECELTELRVFRELNERFARTII